MKSFPKFLLMNFSFLLPALVIAQQLPAPSQASDPSATALLSKSLAALAPQVPITDVTLSGTARRIAGSDDESGTAVLKALGTGPARVDLSFASGPRGEVVGTGDKCLVGSWIGPDGVSHPISNHNLMSDPSWFFPPFTVARLASPAKYVVSWIGAETWNGRSVEHLSAHQPFDMQLPPGLPNLTHPDRITTTDIPLEVRFSDYRSVNGVQVPFHVQKYMNNGLILDLQFTSAVLNSGLEATTFNVGAGL